MCCDGCRKDGRLFAGRQERDPALRESAHIRGRARGRDRCREVGNRTDRGRCATGWRGRDGVCSSRSEEGNAERSGRCAGVQEVKGRSFRERGVRRLRRVGRAACRAQRWCRVPLRDEEVRQDKGRCREGVAAPSFRRREVLGVSDAGVRRGRVCAVRVQGG